MSSWIEVHSSSDFSLHNIPFGVFSGKQEDSLAETRTNHNFRRCCSIIGNFVIDLSALYENGLIFLPDCENIFNYPTLNKFIGLEKSYWREIRTQLFNLFVDDSTGLLESNSRLRNDEDLKRKVLFPIENVQLHLPVEIGDYTDFYSSREHAENVGSIFRGKNSITGTCLQPNWLHLPVGYHGRSSTVVVSGTNVRRPCGQVLTTEGHPEFVPCRSLDFELELGYILGGPENRIGEVRLVSCSLFRSLKSRYCQENLHGSGRGQNIRSGFAEWYLTLSLLL